MSNEFKTKHIRDPVMKASDTSFSVKNRAAAMVFRSLFYRMLLLLPLVTYYTS